MELADMENEHSHPAFAPSGSSAAVAVVRSEGGGGKGQFPRFYRFTPVSSRAFFCVFFPLVSSESPLPLPFPPLGIVSVHTSPRLKQQPSSKHDEKRKSPRHAVVHAWLLLLLPPARNDITLRRSTCPRRRPRAGGRLRCGDPFASTPQRARCCRTPSPARRRWRSGLSWAEDSRERGVVRAAPRISRRGPGRGRFFHGGRGGTGGTEYSRK